MEFRALADDVAVRVAKEEYGRGAREVRTSSRIWLTLDMLEGFAAGGRNVLDIRLFKRNKQYWARLQPVSGFHFVLKLAVENLSNIE